MPKDRSQFVCQQCNYISSKWMGKCPQCESWNSLVEETLHEGSRYETGKKNSTRSRTRKAIPIEDIQDLHVDRIELPFAELNRVLGGGLTRGSVVLLAGEPGVGKSTILLQLLGKLNGNSDTSLLYISGEESARQIKTRSERLNIGPSNIHILPNTDLVEILAEMKSLKPDVVVVDSVQTLFWPDLNSIPGSISQVREVADRLVRFAKKHDTAVVLVGHITKDGSIAGPMTLEHLVDTVLYFEGDRSHTYRILRAVKNRFGPTDEIGVFEMRGSGLEEVSNPSQIFLEGRAEDTPGTVVFPALEGTRPLLIEIQGLATKSSYGVPLRASVGFDKNRLTMLLAVLEKRAGISLSDQDVHVNVVGGFKIKDPAADLAVISAVVSSFLARQIPKEAVVFGEVGLAGEIRSTVRAEARLKEAQKLGFRKALVPQKAPQGQVSIECQVIRSIDNLVELIRA